MQSLSTLPSSLCSSISQSFGAGFERRSFSIPARTPRNATLQTLFDNFQQDTLRYTHHRSNRAADVELSQSSTYRPVTATTLSTTTSSSGKPYSYKSQEKSSRMLDTTVPPARRERTLIGMQCAACEEPLEHTLRGERILQLSCGHVAHEACFYEYIKEFESQDCPTCGAPLGLDTTRGGNLDFEKLNQVVRSIQNTPQHTPQQTPELRGSTTPQYRQTPDLRSTPDMRQTPELRQNTSPRAYVTNGWEPVVRTNRSSSQTNSATFSDLEYRRARSIEQGGQHTRNDSGTTNGGSHTAEFENGSNMRKHDYDVQSMEMSVSGRPMAKNPIPAPTVTVRSEFPSLSRSRQSQSLTCLVTVESVDGKWHADPEDVRGVPSTVPAIPEEDKSLPTKPRSIFGFSREPPHVLRRATEDLHAKVDNWHGLDFSRFGKLILYGSIRVGKDRRSWQDLDCYLFTEMLICVKERKAEAVAYIDSASQRAARTRSTLKGSILIRKHLNQVDIVPDQNTLTLSLSVAELPKFHLLFGDEAQMLVWRKALLNINQIAALDESDELENSGTDEDEFAASKNRRTISSMQSSSYGAARSNYTAPTDYTSVSRDAGTIRPKVPIHVPIDIVVVIPVSSSMQGLKISLLRDVLRFLIYNLGDTDRLGLVTFGSSGGGVPVVGMTTKSWNGWSRILESIKPLGQKSLRADVVEGANVAVDLLMQRKSANALSSILLISDSAITDTESVDFVVSRAEAAKITIHSFGLGLTHKPDTMIELSTRTKATYTYVKDWMMLRECIAGCVGSLQSISHQNVKLKLRLPEGSTARFVKINGALQVLKKSTGRDVEASLGDLHFGDKRDILVQLAIEPDLTSPEQVSGDPWDTIVSGLEALGGPIDSDDLRPTSVEEVPLIQADLTWGDILRQGLISQLPRPSLLAITMLPSTKKSAIPKVSTSPIPPLPSIVQRRMELLTSDMLTRALTLVSRNQADRANHLLTETRTILRGLARGGLPPPPPPPSTRIPPTPALTSNGATSGSNSPIMTATEHPPTPPLSEQSPPPSYAPPPPPSLPQTQSFATSPSTMTLAAGIDPQTINALDAEIESALEWISHPAIFGRDTRKAVLQAIGVISSQRAFTYRTAVETLWADRVPGVKRLGEQSREWREAVQEENSLMEEV